MIVLAAVSKHGGTLEEATGIADSYGFALAAAPSMQALRRMQLRISRTPLVLDGKFLDGLPRTEFCHCMKVHTKIFRELALQSKIW